MPNVCIMYVMHCLDCEYLCLVQTEACQQRVYSFANLKSRNFTIMRAQFFLRRIGIMFLSKWGHAEQARVLLTFNRTRKQSKNSLFYLGYYGNSLAGCRRLNSPSYCSRPSNNSILQIVLYEEFRKLKLTLRRYSFDKISL